MLKIRSVQRFLSNNIYTSLCSVRYIVWKMSLEKIDSINILEIFLRDFISISDDSPDNSCA